MAEAALTNVFAFSEQRDDVARFFAEVIGLKAKEAHQNSVWFEPAGGATLTVHDPENEAGRAFIPWFHAPDIAATFERARARNAVVGSMRDGYFFARDPDGRIFGVRQWR